MKISVILLALCLAAPALGLDRPAEVPSKITELRTKNWYQELSMSWKTYLEANSKDALGWVEYYKAAAFAGQNAEALTAIALEASVVHAGSFTSKYLSFMEAGWTAEGVSQLEAALQLEKGHLFSLEDQLILAELTRPETRKELAESVVRSGLIHSSTMNYTYNLLMSVNEGGLLITDGLHTTIPLWVLQDVMNVRTDVQVLNLELARSQQAYLDRILAARNLESSLDALLSEESIKDIYYALTLPRRRLQQLENRLFVVGLASTNTARAFDHFETLRANIEDKFLMDYLTIDFNGEPKTATGNILSSNYIVPLLVLKEFYDNLNNDERSQALRKQILALAEDSQIKTRVELLLNADKSPRSFKIIELDIKTIDKRMKQIKNEIYASEVELSNREYWNYMEYLRTNGYDELYEKGRADLSGYDDLTKAMLSNYHYSPENVQALKAKRRGGDYQDYPALDLTHEVAKAYCEWLTVQYNSQEKRKFKKVQFRLPTKEEWTMAALGYKDFTSWNLAENTVNAKEHEGKADYQTHDLSQNQIHYPWGLNAWNLRNSITNDKDCFLANIKAGANIVCAAGIKGDGFTMASPVSTYFANQMGLYDVVGNIAEMVDQEGIAMGGSWNHEAELSNISSEYRYDKSDISVGFRLFMEVIED